MTQARTALPTIDLARAHADLAQRAAFFEEVRHTAHDFGFFYVRNHGVDPDLISAIQHLARAFFNLPEADKQSIQMVHSPHFRGYNQIGNERTRGLRDWREQVDFGAEREALPRNPDAPAWTRLRGPNQWPGALPELRDVVLRYQAACTDLAIQMLQVFAQALGQPANVFEQIYVPEPHYLLKIIRYPGRDMTESDQGVGAHKDSGFLTVLLQDDQPGLQVEHEGRWIDATPTPGTFVINVGEVLEMASNGYLRANVHRVITPAPRTERLSVPFFFAARLDATVPVLQLPPELAERTRGVTVDPLNPLFHDVGRNHLKSRLRSHPDVALRHHADLLDEQQLTALRVQVQG
jgi:isopenicillin N synthase-like dioxygenase